MDMAQPDPGETRPTDPDLKWTGWALGTLRELAEIDMRSKRMLAQQQAATPVRPETPDFGLMQSRLSRSVRLSVAMTERIRRDYLMRRAERESSGEQKRRRRRREQAVEAAVKAIASVGDGQDVEHVRAMVREALVEDEILDAQLDRLSPEEFVQAVCRKIGRPPPPIPRDRGEVVEDAPRAGTAAATDHEPAEGWAPASDESGRGRPVPTRRNRTAAEAGSALPCSNH